MYGVDTFFNNLTPDYFVDFSNACREIEFCLLSLGDKYNIEFNTELFFKPKWIFDIQSISVDYSKIRLDPQLTTEQIIHDLNIDNLVVLSRVKSSIGYVCPNRYFVPLQLLSYVYSYNKCYIISLINYSDFPIFLALGKSHRDTSLFKVIHLYALISDVVRLLNFSQIVGDILLTDDVFNFELQMNNFISYFNSKIDDIVEDCIGLLSVFLNIDYVYNTFSSDIRVYSRLNPGLVRRLKRILSDFIYSEFNRVINLLGSTEIVPYLSVSSIELLKRLVCSYGCFVFSKDVNEEDNLLTYYQRLVPLVEKNSNCAYVWRDNPVYFMNSLFTFTADVVYQQMLYDTELQNFYLQSISSLNLSDYLLMNKVIAEFDSYHYFYSSLLFEFWSNIIKDIVSHFNFNSLLSDLVSLNLSIDINENILELIFIKSLRCRLLAKKDDNFVDTYMSLGRTTFSNALHEITLQLVDQSTLQIINESVFSSVPVLNRLTSLYHRSYMCIVYKYLINELISLFLVR